MRTERINFQNMQGHELSGRLDLPEDEKPVAFALFAHCFTCGKNLKSAVAISEALNREKIAVLRFDFSGIGDSEGDFAEKMFSHNIDDLVAAAEYLEKNYAAPQIIIGHSLGGCAAVMAAPKISSTRAVITIASPSEPRHVIGHFDDQREKLEAEGEASINLPTGTFTIRKAFLDDLEAHTMADTLQKLDVALLVMHSPLDLTVSIDHAAQIYKAARHPKSFITLDRADHLLSRKEDALYAGALIAAWSRRYLDQPATRKAPSLELDNRVTARTGSTGFFTELFANGHALIADEPKSYGGTERGPSPYEYLLAGLGACTSMTVQMYARHKKWPLEDAVVRLSHNKIHAKDCSDCETTEGKIDKIDRELELIGDLNEEQRERLLEIADRCPVHKTLHGEIKVKTELRKK